MRTSRTISILFFAATLLVGAGCGGGGGGGGGGSAGTATLSGRVITRNGTTSNLGGVGITLVGVGSDTTSSDGTFAFGLVPAGTLVLRINDPLAARVAAATVRTAAEGGDDDQVDDGDDIDDDNGDASDDDFSDDGDDNDTGDDDMDVAEVRDGESVEVRISVENGVITSVEVARSGSDDRECESRMLRTDDAPLGVEGKVEAESRTDRERLKVEAEHFTSGASLEAVVICEGVEESLGLRTANVEGEAKWEIATNDGGVLPHGATTVAELVGCTVEVRDGTTGTAYLRGEIREIPATADDHDGDGEDDDDGGSEGDRLRGRSFLARVTATSGESHCEIERRTDEGTRNEFKVEVEGYASAVSVQVWLADGGGVLTQVGTFSVNAEGFGKWELESQDGDTMPFGVTDVTTLSGRAIELRNASGGAVLFGGTVPTAVTID